MRMGGAKGSPCAPTQLAMQAAALMAERRSALLVSGPEGTVGGILTPKDLLFRSVAAGLPTSAKVEQVMTSAPDMMDSGARVLQALHQLSTGGYRSVPVVDADGTPTGVLDALALIEAALNSEEPVEEAKEPPATPAVPTTTTTTASPTAALGSTRALVAAAVIGGVVLTGLAVARSPSARAAVGGAVERSRAAVGGAAQRSRAAVSGAAERSRAALGGAVARVRAAASR